jgi:hypothetical protein
MLQELEKVNPDFYPLPVGNPELRPDGIKHFSPITDGFMDKQEFALLYDKTSEFIHVGNPFGPQNVMLNLKYSVKGWIERIQTLLRLHIMYLLDDKKWIVQIPDSGPIRVAVADPHAV